MEESARKLQEEIGRLFREDLRLMGGGIPTNGIWSVCKLPDTDYQGAIRVLPSGFTPGEYSLWVDVFETIYDPVYSNTLVKGSLEEIKTWLQDEGHIPEVLNCMHHLYELAREGL